MEVWPNFFIVGAPKAGTTSLYFYLKQVPEVYLSPVKEPNYFSVKIIPDDHYLLPIRNKKNYLKLFEKVKDEKAIGEASPSYLEDPETPYLISQDVSDARIIAILRDPVERAFSHYLMMVSQGFEKLSFRKALDDLLTNKTRHEFRHYLTPGQYSEQIKRYINIFGNEKVKILIFEEFIRDTQKSIEEVLNFLGINKKPSSLVGNTYNPFSVSRGWYADLIMTNTMIRKIGLSLIPNPDLRQKIKGKLLKKAKKPEMFSEEREFLQKYYMDDAKKLQNSLNRKLPWGWLN